MTELNKVTFLNVYDVDKKSLEKLTIGEIDKLEDLVNELYYAEECSASFTHIELKEVIKFSEAAKKILITYINDAILLIADDIYESYLNDYDEDTKNIEMDLRNDIASEVHYFGNKYKSSLVMISYIDNGIELLRELINSIPSNNELSKNLNETIELNRTLKIEINYTHNRVHNILKEIMIEQGYGYMVNMLP